MSPTAFHCLYYCSSGHLGRQKDGDLRKAGLLPREVLAYLGLAEGSKQSYTMHPDKCLKSHPFLSPLLAWST